MQLAWWRQQPPSPGYYLPRLIVQLDQRQAFLLRHKILELDPSEQALITIAYPDDGAQKRFSHKFADFPQIICGKVRDGEQRIVKVKEGSAEGRHCVMIDDLVQSGGTLLNCAKAMRAQGAAKVSCFVTHGVFPNQTWKKFIPAEGEERLIDHFWMTDSIPSTVDAIKEAATEQSPFEILSIAPLIGKLLTGQST